jgi:hypothetical protein
MRFIYEVLYGSLVIEALLREKLITKDHYDHMWEIFNERSNQLTYTLLDLSEVVLNLEQVDCEMIINYMAANHNVTEFYHTKIAI